MEKEFKEKIIEDLKKTGFGSEMKALKVFHSSGWRAELGRSYLDEDENISREIDISADIPGHLYSGGKICVSNFFHIYGQVKKSKSPWIIFRNNLAGPKFCAWNNIISAQYLPMDSFELAKIMSKNSLLIKKRCK